MADVLGLGAAALGLAFIGWLSAGTLTMFVRETLAHEPVAAKQVTTG
jgi:hypothetical protein